MSDRLDDIKYWSVINEQTIHPKVSLYKSDFDWLIKQAEKVEQYEKALNDIAKELNRYCSEGWTTKALEIANKSLEG
jgi:hypothetical protein